MSNAALSWARAQRGMTPAAKAVLMVLADCANEHHDCWPSQASIADEIGASRQTVNEIIWTFARCGVLTIGGNGQRRSYRLSVVSPDTPVSCQPTPETPNPTLVSPQPTPSVASADTNPKEPSLTQTDAIASGTTARSAADERRRQSRGTRLEAAWQPCDEDRRFSESLGLDPGAIAEQFRDYWLACPGGKGVKLDWCATWRNWCRREAESRAAGMFGGQRSGGNGRGYSKIAAALDRVVIKPRGENVH